MANNEGNIDFINEINEKTLNNEKENHNFLLVILVQIQKQEQKKIDNKR